MGYPVVTFNADEYGFSTVSCTYPKEMSPVIAKLKKGSVLLSVGTCDGIILGQVLLKNCE